MQMGSSQHTFQYPKVTPVSAPKDAPQTSGTAPKQSGASQSSRS